MSDENMRAKSRRQWTSTSSSLEDINCGSLLRIADAAESMAKSHTLLEQRAKSAEENAKFWQSRYQQQLLANRGLRGVITKLKKARATGAKP